MVWAASGADHVRAATANAVVAARRNESEEITVGSTPSGGRSPSARPHVWRENGLFEPGPQGHAPPGRKDVLKALIWQHRDRNNHIFGKLGPPPPSGGTQVKF